MRVLCAFLVCLCLFSDKVYAACSSVPFSFVAGTTIASGQVNSNFAALVSCINAINGAQITAGTIATAQGGTGHGNWTAGSVVFASSTTLLSQDNANFFWDATNHRLGLGNAVPLHTLDITGDLNTTGNGVIGGGSFTIKGFGFQDATTFLKLTDSTFATLQPLVVGTLSPGLTATAGATTACFVTGQYVAATVGLTVCASDARLKNIIGPIANGALTLVDDLKPTAFFWKSDVDYQMHSGFIAQDVQKVMPECVTRNPDGMLSIETNCLVAYNTKSIQELNGRLTKLESYGSKSTRGASN